MVTKVKDAPRCLYVSPSVELLEVREEEFILGYDNIIPAEEDDWGEG